MIFTLDYMKINSLKNDASSRAHTARNPIPSNKNYTTMNTENYFYSSFHNYLNGNGSFSKNLQINPNNLKKNIIFKTTHLQNMEDILINKSKKNSKISTLSNFMSKSDFYYDKI